jgi:hypothetical protein
LEGGENMKSMKPIYVIILVVVFAAAGFYGGTVYQKNQAAGSAAAGSGQYGSRRFGAGGGAGASGMTPVSGKIVATGDNSITIQLADGSSKIVDLTSQTTVNKTTKGATSDLTSGTKVTAIGSTNSDGSITAMVVSIGNGMFRMMRSQGSGGQAQPSGSQ